MVKREILKYVLLSIVTCGIYFLVVSYKQLTELEAEGATLKIPAWAVVLLLLFVTPAGGALLGYVGDDAINQVREKRGLPRVDNMILWLVIGIFLDIVTGALLQDSMNKLIDGNKDQGAAN